MRRAADLVARVLSRLFQLAVVLVTLAIVVVIVFGGVTTQRGWPQTTGQITIDGLHAPVTVSRDRYGIIQVTADDQHDLFMAQGYAHAQNDIGFMLGFGEGVPPRDDIEAYKWLSLAIEHYSLRNEDRLEQAKKDLASLAARMAPAEIAEAERRAKAWKPVP